MNSGDRASRRWLQWPKVPVAALVLVLSLCNVAWAAPAAKVAPSAPPTVMVFGDSLSAAYGLDAAQGWVALVEQRLHANKPGWRVVNASISGETSAGGAARVVREVARVRPAVVVIALGANDGLRGLPPRETRRNLARMIGAAQGVGAKVLLVGMRLPPNYGSEYTRAFEQNYRDLAKLFDTALLPFLLEPVALDRKSFQADNLHPVAEAQPALRDHVWHALEPLLE